MLLAFVLLAQWCTGFCCSQELEAARMEIEVYLDPTPANCAAAADDLSRNVLAQLVDPSNQEAASACAGYVRDRIDEIRTRPDPRSWNPTFVANIVRRARREDADVDPRVPYWHADSATNRFRAELVTLMPMGLGNAIEVIQPKHWHEPGINAPPLRSDQDDYNLLEHVPGEFVVYEDDWARANPDVPPLLSMRGSEKQRWVHEMRLYVQKRWAETDASAPHPEINEIRAAVLSSKPE